MGPAVTVVGAGGTLGSLLLARLGARGLELRCPDPTDDGRADELLDAEVVVHAGGPRVRPGLGWADYFREHVGVTTAVVRCMRPGARLVQISSTAVFGARGERLDASAREAPTRFPSPAYACAKLAAEAVARAQGRERGVQVRVLRASMVYGPGVDSALETLRRLHRRGVRLRLVPDRVRQHLLHVDVLVRAVERAIAAPLEAGEPPIPIADPFVLTNEDLGPPAGRALRFDVDVAVAASVHRKVARGMGVTPGPLEALAVLGMDNEFDVEPMRRVLGVDVGMFGRATTFEPYWSGGR